MAKKRATKKLAAKPTATKGKSAAKKRTAKVATGMSLDDRIEARIAAKKQQAEADWPPQGWEIPNSFPNEPTPDAILEWLNHLTKGDGKLVPLEFLERKHSRMSKGKGEPLARDLYRLVRHLRDSQGWSNPPEEQMDDRYSYHDVRLLIDKVEQWIRSEDDPAEGKTRRRGEGEAGYLGLIVDEMTGNVQCQGDWKSITLNTGSAEWQTFFVAYKARSEGATQAQWENGYPGLLDPEPMRQAKSRTNSKLKVLGIQLAPGIPPKLEIRRA